MIGVFKQHGLAFKKATVQLRVKINFRRRFVSFIVKVSEYNEKESILNLFTVYF